MIMSACCLGVHPDLLGRAIAFVWEPVSEFPNLLALFLFHLFFMSEASRAWDVDRGRLLPASLHQFVPPGQLAHFV